MERGSSGHMDETMNLRSFYLRFVKKIWILPLAAILGGALALGIYTLAITAFGPERQYSADSTLYISFAYDENKGSLVDWYNAFTWNTLIVTDEVLDPIVDELKMGGINVVDGMVEATSENSISIDELKASINADIPSDVRVMVFTVTNSDPEMANKILGASVKSLENYGRINDAFDSIRKLSINEAKLVVYTDRSVAAAILGAVIGAVLILLIFLLLDTLDDAVYVPEDIEKRYNLSALGVTFVEKDDFFRNELIAACEPVFAGKSRIAVISSDSVKNDAFSTLDMESVKNTLGPALKEDIEFIPMAVPGSVLDNYRKIGSSDGVILCVPYAKKSGAMAEHIIAQLKKHECPILGIIMTRADKRFLYRYYRL